MMAGRRDSLFQKLVLALEMTLISDDTAGAATALIPASAVVICWGAEVGDCWPISTLVGVGNVQKTCLFYAVRRERQKGVFGCEKIIKYIYFKFGKSKSYRL